jgi:hypothetical protein
MNPPPYRQRPGCAGAACTRHCGVGRGCQLLGAVGVAVDCAPLRPPRRTPPHQTLPHLSPWQEIFAGSMAGLAGACRRGIWGCPRFVFLAAIALVIFLCQVGSKWICPQPHLAPRVPTCREDPRVSYGHHQGSAAVAGVARYGWCGLVGWRQFFLHVMAVGLPASSALSVPPPPRGLRFPGKQTCC